jgi:hypothetical protein
MNVCPTDYVRTDTRHRTMERSRSRTLCSRLQCAEVLTSSLRFWVDFCTDQNVASKNCINVCPQRYPSGNVRLTPCNGKADSERWCCGEKTDCCSTSEVVLLAQVLGGKLSSGSASSASVATASGASTSISAPTSSSTSSRSAPGLDNTGKSSGISTGAIVGIIVGVLAAVALLATAIFLIRRARKTPAPYVAEAPDNPPQYQYQSVAVEKDAYAHRSELPQSPLVELSSEMPTELPAEEIHRGV